MIKLDEEIKNTLKTLIEKLDVANKIFSDLLKKDLVSKEELDEAMATFEKIIKEVDKL